MSELVAISDLHLGDREFPNGSILTDDTERSTFIRLLKEITRGNINTLVINGDLFEACVPQRTFNEVIKENSNYWNLATSTLEDSQSFFEELSSQINIGFLIWIPGNHDYSLFNKILDGRNPYTSPNGYALRHDGRWYYDDRLYKLFGYHIKNIAVAYPNYLYKTKDNWPIAVFTHGHLFDDQILNPSRDFLSKIGIFAETGCVWPEIKGVIPSPNLKWMEELVKITSPRIKAIWPGNLNYIKEQVYNSSLRRQIHIVCKERTPFVGMQQLTPIFKDIGQDPLIRKIPWFYEGFYKDENSNISNIGKTCSYFVKGHTHLGDFYKFNDSKGRLFKVIDCGGFTLDAAGHNDNVPHAHVICWDKFPDELTCYALNIGKP